MKYVVWVWWALLLAGASMSRAADGAGLVAKVAGAKAGTTVALPAGTFELAGLTVPAGVSLKGAGYDKTILRVTGQIGLRVKGGAKVTISDLTVQGAASTGVLLENVQGATVARVRALRCLTGVMITGGQGIRLENCAAGENRTGVVINNAAKSVIVNCSLVRNSALGMSLSGTTNSAAFNNLFAANAIGIFLAESNAHLALDHNFYWGALIGKGTDAATPSLYSWRDLEAQDHHSVFMPIDFVDAAAFNYRPAAALPWAQDRAVNDGWGTTTLAGFTAPATDITGTAWRFGVGAGAWASTVTPVRPADGTFTIASADGYKSAGLFDAQNREVAWLFTMLPLPKGTYHYWLPSRDWQGRPVPAGTYTLRISEANLSMKYLASAGNSGVASIHDAYASTGIDQVVFDSKDRPVLCLHWSESYRQFRAMDPKLERERWMIPGCAATLGAAADGKGKLYSLREADNTTYVLSRIDEETGVIDEVAPGDFGWYLSKPTLGDIRGLAVLDDTVYLANYTNDNVLVGPAFTNSFTVTKPLSPCADRQRKLIWLISNREKVVALDATGAVRYVFVPKIPGLYSLAVSGNRMALLSPFTGKVYLYDISEPITPKPLRTIGSGDGPFGPIQPDRFQFQTKRLDTLPGHCRVSLDSQGTVAVTDVYGVKLFNWDGTVKRAFEGIWGQYIEAGAWKPGEPMELVDLTSLRTMTLDEKTGTTQWGVMYGLPEVNGFVHDNNSGFFFLRDGKRFGVHKGERLVPGKDNKPARVGTYLIARYDTAVGTPVLAFSGITEGKLARFDDFTKDLSDNANWQVITTSQGQTLPSMFHGGNALVAQRNGDILLGENIVRRIPLGSVDANGVPVYDFDHLQQLRLRGDAQDGSITSLYDYKTREDFPGGVRHAESFPDGTLISTVYLKKTGHGSGLCNWSGTEVAGYDANGTVRWVQSMAHIKDVEGTKILDDLSYSVACPYSEVQILDKDGMFLGITGVPKELYWEGMWLDNTRQFTVLKGNTGKHYVVFGNFNDCVAWWMEVQGRESIKRQEQPVTINEALAAVLAAQPEPPVWRKPENTTTQVKIAKLAAPLPIDGDLAKWRAILPTPQILITPETGTNMHGPTDACAVIRLAHEGGNLYVQMLRFDDLVTMHQPLAVFYKQDALEMSLNSFITGIKINVTHTRDAGDIVFRDGWFLKGKALDQATAPRVVKVLDHARAVEERKLLEQIYGVDLTNSKVIITEFKVPLNEETFADRKEAMPNAVSGSTMALGFGVDDNDSPGADLQKMMVWPATYNTFGDRSVSATVIFE